VVLALKFFFSITTAVFEKKLDQGCWVEIQEVEELDLRAGSSTKFSTWKKFENIFFLFLSWG
jgi:hypothetical protein